MSRRRRPHLPGATFHLTARLHQREALFTPELRSALVAVLREQVAFADVELFAYVVMPNHFHLVVRQGKAPLSCFMQPLLQRAALRVQRAHGREGHVFERRYRDRPCADLEHLRNAIAYTHLNPVRAGLCTEPGSYAWSSHGAWMGDELAADGRPHPVSLACASQLFATGPARTRDELSRDYLAFLRWREAHDRLQAGGAEAELRTPAPPRPLVGYRDADLASDWVFAPSAGRDGTGEVDPASAWTPISTGAKALQALRSDLGAIARAVLQAAEPGLDPALVRSRWGGPAYVRARHRIIRRAAAAGYRGVQIAAYLRISTTAVYDVLAAERKRLRSPHR
ncbi:MAG TPA: transposase [Longimicrobiales bacterium]